MNRELCRTYLEDPESNQAHLAVCEECSAIFEQLDAHGGHEPVRMEHLPLASWEGATYRAWPLVAAAMVMVLSLTAALLAAAGASPFLVLGSALRESVPSFDLLLSFAGLARGVVESAPVFVIVSFLIVNALLVALLRRAPRGVDA